MKKRVLFLLVTLTFIISTIVMPYAATDQVVPANSVAILQVNGKTIDTSSYSMYLNAAGDVMIPLRGIMEPLDASITWDNKQRTALIKTDSDEITVSTDFNTIDKNNAKTKLDYSIDMKNGRIYVPTDFITEILGFRIELNIAKETINIISPQTTQETLQLSLAEQLIQTNLKAYLTSLELNRNFSGQILVEQEGKILLDRSYGFANYEKQLSVFNTTTFSIGSMTKQFTAAAIAQLVEKGIIAYTDKVSKYLSNVPNGDKMTLHQLLTHTSGIINYTDIINIETLDATSMDFNGIMTFIKDKPLNFEPGTSWSYSNTGYLILGEIVEKVSGQKLEQYLQERLFDPLGMTHTGVSYQGDQKVVEATGYTGYVDTTPDQYDAILMNIAYGAGYLYSTAEDIYRWDVALQSGKVVSKDSLAKIFGQQFQVAEKVYYGYGWFISQSTYGSEINHGGNTVGFTSENAIYTDKNARIILLTNKGYQNLTTIKQNIEKILAGQKIAPAQQKESYVLATADLDNYTGKYQVSGMKLYANMSKLSDQLIVNFSGITCLMAAESKTKFYSRELELELEYTLGNDGKATAVTILYEGQVFPCTKAPETEKVTVPLAQLSKYVGTYEIKNMFKFTVSVKEGKMMFQAEGQPEFEVEPISETKFEAQVFGVLIEFDDKEHPSKCTIDQSGMTFEGIKLNELK